MSKNLQTSAVIVRAVTSLATDVAAPVIFTMTPFDYVTKSRHITPTAAHGPASTVGFAGDVALSSLRTKTAVIAIGRAIIRRFPAKKKNVIHLRFDGYYRSGNSAFFLNFSGICLRDFN